MTHTDHPAAEIRRARPEEADLVADLYWQVRSENVASIPAVVHSQEEVRRWARERLLGSYDVWVAEEAGELVGFVALAEPDWIDQLYVLGSAAGRGLGGRLVALAKREFKGAVQLWTFQSNLGAQRFYERHGFVPVERTDADNEEGAPDVRYLFSPTRRTWC